MRKLGVFLLMLSLVAAMQAQDKKSVFSCMAKKNILNHMDVGVNVGTLGIGIDVAVPVTDYARIRTGYNFMPRLTLKSDFPIETRNGGSLQRFFDKKDKINDEFNKYDIDLNEPGLEVYKDAFDKFQALEQKDFKDFVTMGLQPNLYQFKFLVDILPFKHNKHWSLTAGFFVGSTNIGEAYNMEEETKLLQAVSAYNNIYTDYLYNQMNLPGGHGDIEYLTNFFTENGVAGFPLGYFDDGTKAMMVPGDGTVRAEMEISKVRPYIGLGYNTHLSRNRRWNLNVDAGILFLCGNPSVYVDNVYKIDANPLKGYFDDDWEYHYVSGMGFNPDDIYYGDIVRPNEDWSDFDIDEPVSHVDLVHDLHNMPNGKVRDMVNTISKFKVYPHVSVGVSFRLF